MPWVFISTTAYPMLAERTSTVYASIGAQDMKVLVGSLFQLLFNYSFERYAVKLV
jgi:hypothetical protein